MLQDKTFREQEGRERVQTTSGTKNHDQTILFGKPINQ